jgi:hypothetical protein
MGLLEKSDENKRTAKKCKETQAYNAGSAGHIMQHFKGLNMFLETTLFLITKIF